jgi:hypothetical protein
MKLMRMSSVIEEGAIIQYDASRGDATAPCRRCARGGFDASVVDAVKGRRR